MWRFLTMTSTSTGPHCGLILASKWLQHHPRTQETPCDVELDRAYFFLRMGCGIFAWFSWIGWLRYTTVCLKSLHCYTVSYMLINFHSMVKYSEVDVVATVALMITKYTSSWTLRNPKLTDSCVDLSRKHVSKWKKYKNGTKALKK